jgi:hypothetical protein
VLQRNCRFVKFTIYANSVNGFDIRIYNTTLNLSSGMQFVPLTKI